MNENVPPGERENIRAWARQIFGSMPLARQFEWAKGGAYRIVVYDGEIPVSFLKIHDRTAISDDQQIRIGGVAGVMTPTGHRGKGYAGLALQEGKRIIFEDLGADLGLLLCESDLIAFYVRHGWKITDCLLEFEQPSGRAAWPHCTMILPKLSEKLLPKSTLSLQKSEGFRVKVSRVKP